MSSPINPGSLDQADYMKIFMQELTYQDPLKPVDNKEFMAQMAQFSALQQATETNQNLKNLLKMTASTQALALLGKTVSYGDHKSGRVSQVVYENQIAKLQVRKVNEETETISMNDVTAIGE